MDSDRFEPELLLAAYPDLYAMPDRITADAAWHRHLPVATWCVAALQPALFVELNTESGDSYTAFCAAVAARNLPTRCFAVDRRTTRRAADARAELWRHHARYRFSTLLAASVEEARGWFSDGSIDLLHLNSIHSADEAGAAYDRYRRKLSPSAVVLIAGAGEPGLRDFWAKLSGAHPSLFFPDGSGLGLLAPGAHPPREFMRLAGLDPARRARLLRLFEHLGRTVEAHGIRQRAGMQVNGLHSSLVDGEIGAERALVAQIELDEATTARCRLEAELRDVRALVQEGAQQELERGLALRARDEAFRLAAAPRDVVPAAPVVSILVVAQDGWHHTLRCLDAVRAQTGDVPYELIVVDDDSCDGTWQRLRLQRGIRLLRNRRRLGRLRSCNEGARHARGKFLVLLGQDTLVQAGWLEALLHSFTLRPDAGLVGAQLVAPDGRLRAAGGILFGDGSRRRYGSGEDPSRPAYNFLRDADFCPSACVALPLALWRALDGFDERFDGSAEEDCDLAIRIRAAGRGVLYQPTVRVTQVGAAPDPQPGSLLHRRWGAALASLGAPSDELHLFANRPARRRVLFIDERIPSPDRDAGSVYTAEMMRNAQRVGFTVSFHADDQRPRGPSYIDDLAREGIEFLQAPYVPSLRAHLERCGDRYDLVVMFRVTCATRHLDDLRKFAPRAPIVFHVADLHFLRAERRARLTGEGADAAAELRRRELGVVAAADCTVVHSPVEQDLLAKLVPGAPTYWFPWVLDVVGTEVGFEPRDGLVFVGGYGHTPNVDAVLYFVEKVLPLLLAEEPSLVFYVVGADPPPEIEALASDHVVVTGYVPDLQPWFDRCRVSVAPLRYGAGIKGKVAAAMGHGLPVVASSVAAEGMDVENGRDMLIADEPAAMADAILRLHRDADLWRRVSVAAQEFVEANYSSAAGDRRFAEIVAMVGAP